MNLKETITEARDVAIKLITLDISKEYYKETTLVNTVCIKFIDEANNYINNNQNTSSELLKFSQDILTKNTDHFIGLNPYFPENSSGCELDIFNAALSKLKTSNASFTKATADDVDALKDCHNNLYPSAPTFYDDYGNEYETAELALQGNQELNEHYDHGGW